MKTELKDKTLTLYLTGKVDTSNAKTTDEEISSAVEMYADTTDSIVLDMKELVYISSAGLRVLLKLRQDSSLPIKIVNVSDDIYDILEVTGFVEILEIEKAQ